MSEAFTDAERRVVLAFVKCARAGKHDFNESNICRCCGAKKGDPSLADLLRKYGRINRGPHC